MTPNRTPHRTNTRLETRGLHVDNLGLAPVKYFSMFSGIGGFELGINRAFSIWYGTAETTRTGTPESSVESTPESEGYQWVSPSRTSTGEPGPLLCVGYSEIDKYAIKVYERHFKHENYGNATTINPSELEMFDLLVGGFPCQAFSVARKRRGFQDTRGTLFFEIARILADKRPRHILLENVKGLLSHDSGKTFQTILGVLADLGYRVEWQVLNSKDFGVPQNRERIYIVGHLRRECGRQVFPITKQGNQNTTLGKSTETAVARTLTGGGHSGGNHSGMTILQLNNPKHSNDRVYSDSGISPTLNTMQGGMRQPFVSSQTRIRRLTPIECERLQGFPDDWTAGESDTQRYKMCGNAVTVNVVEAIMTRLLPCLTVTDVKFDGPDVKNRGNDKSPTEAGGVKVK